MNLVVPEMGNCTRAALDLELPCTARRFRHFGEAIGIGIDDSDVSLIGLLPDEKSVLAVALRLRRRRKSMLNVGIELCHVVKRPDKRVTGGGVQIDPMTFWKELVALAPEPLSVNAEVSFHYPAGTYRLKEVDLQGLEADVPENKPVAFVDGVSLRFANFPHGLQRVRVYTVGPLRGKKCVQVDVYHGVESALSEGVFAKVISLSRVAAGIFVDGKGASK